VGVSKRVVDVLGAVEEYSSLTKYAYQMRVFPLL